MEYERYTVNKSNNKQNIVHVNNPLLKEIPFINKRIVHKIEQAYKDEEQDNSFKLDKTNVLVMRQCSERPAEVLVLVVTSSFETASTI